MSRLAVVLWMSVCLACGFAGAQETSEPSHTRATSAQPELQRILTDWAARESMLRSGELEWRIDRQNRSPTFGGSAANEDSSAAAGEPRLLRTVFDARGFRLKPVRIS